MCEPDKSPSVSAEGEKSEAPRRKPQVAKTRGKGVPNRHMVQRTDEKRGGPATRAAEEVRDTERSEDIQRWPNGETSCVSTEHLLKIRTLLR